MKLSTRWRRIFISAGTLVAILTLWILFAPRQFGGSASVVILSGNSMSPNFVINDLVIVKENNTYQIGDAVAYEHPSIGYVFHRIIALNPDGTFLLQGDHNTWTDSFTPTSAEIVGNLWLHIPKAGNALKTLRTPLGFAILIAVFLLLFYLSLLPQEKKSKRNPMSSSSSNPPNETVFLLAVLLLGAIVLGIASFRQPALREVSTPLGYEEQAFFRYTANVPDGIYDSTQISPGEPIFRRLNGSFAIDMDYLFISTAPNNLSGNYRLLARVSDGSGWKRTIELTPASEFSGNVFTTSGALALDNIQAFIDALETETGIERGRYELSIITEIQTEGTVDGQSLKSTFSPALTFSINDLEVVLQGESATALNPTQSGMLTRTDYITNTLNIFGLKVPVRNARVTALGLGLVSLALLIAQLAQIYRSSQQNEFARLKLWYGSRLIEARDPSLLARPNIVEIATLDGLASLAEIDQRTILYLSDNGLQHFFVQTPEQLYHYEMDVYPETSHPLLEKPQEKSFSVFGLLRMPGQKKLKAAYEHALKGWAGAVDKRLSIEGQSERVAEMAYQLAKALGLEGKVLEDIRMAAYLHKIGLMDVPDELLEKKKKLSEKELEILHNHPTYARNHLQQTDLLKPIAEAIYYQHERWDGTGQPEGLAGEDIPIGARIISIVSVWSGLSQSRTYRDAWSQEDICLYFKQKSGQNFDPRFTEVFLTKVIASDSLECQQDTLSATVVSAETN